MNSKGKNGRSKEQTAFPIVKVNDIMVDAMKRKLPAAQTLELFRDSEDEWIAKIYKTAMEQLEGFLSEYQISWREDQKLMYLYDCYSSIQDKNVTSDLFGWLSKISDRKGFNLSQHLLLAPIGRKLYLLDSMVDLKLRDKLRLVEEAKRILQPIAKNTRTANIPFDLYMEFCGKLLDNPELSYSQAGEKIAREGKFPGLKAKQASDSFKKWLTNNRLHKNPEDLWRATVQLVLLQFSLT